MSYWVIVFFIYLSFVWFGLVWHCQTLYSVSSLRDSSVAKTRFLISLRSLERHRRFSMLRWCFHFREQVMGLCNGLHKGYWIGFLSFSYLVWFGLEGLNLYCWLGTNHGVRMTCENFATFIVHVIHEWFFSSYLIKWTSDDWAIGKLVDCNDIAEIVAIGKHFNSFHLVCLVWFGLVWLLWDWSWIKSASLNIGKCNFDKLIAFCCIKWPFISPYVRCCPLRFAHGINQIPRIF